MNVYPCIQWLFLLVPTCGLLAISDPYSIENIDIEKNRQAFHKIIREYEEEAKADPENIRLLVAIAEVYYSLQEYGKSIQYYRQALDLDPTNIRIKTSLALSYLNNNELQKSKKLLDEIIKEDPTNLVVIGSLGRIDALQNHFQEAEALYQKVLSVDPDNLTTLYYLGELRISQKKFSEAVMILKPLVEEQPKASWVRRALQRAILGPIAEQARDLEKRGDVNAAITLYQQQLVKDPANIDIYIDLGGLYNRQGDYAQAINIIKQGLKLYPKENSLRLALGFAYLAKGRLSRAKTIFKKIAQKESNPVEAIAGLGRVAALSGDAEDAERLYQQAIRMNPFDALAYSYLAQLKLDQKRYEEAIQLFQKILEIDPDATWAKQAIEDAEIAPLIEEAQQEEKKHNLEKATLRYEQALAKAPNNIDGYIRLGQFYLSHAQYQKAIQTYLLGLKINPESTPIDIALGYAYLRSLELDRAQRMFKLALEHEPNNMDALLGLGKLAALIGNTTDALDIYSWALSVDPKNMMALSFLADLKMEQKAYHEAQALFAQILKIDPSANWAKQAMLRAKYGPAFDEARELEAAGRWNEAVAVYRKIIETSPESEDAYLGLGALYSQVKDYRKAADLYQEAVIHHPKANQLRVNLGLTYLNLQHVKRAKQTLEQALKNDPSSADAMAGLGRVAAVTGNPILAKKMYEDAIEHNPNNLLALSYLGELFLAQKQFVKAQQVYEKIVQINPHATWAAVILENAKYAPLLEQIEEKENSKDFSNAVKLYLRLISQAPGNVGYYIKLGRLYIKMKEVDKAISFYRHSLHLFPDSTDLPIALGFAYIANGDLKKGKQIFDKILKQNPKNPEALAGEGRVAELSGNLIAAKAWYRTALSVNPHNITALTYLAQLSFDQGDYAGAQKLYKKLSYLEPSESWIRSALEDAKHGTLLAEIKKKEAAKDFIGAETLWKQLLLESPDTTDYYLRMGFFYQRIKQYEKAIDTFKKGIEITPSSSELYAALGLAYISKKDLSDARKAFRKSLKLDPKNPDALAGLGYAFFLEGKASLATNNNEQLAHQDFSKAEKYIKMALAVDPNRIAALSALGELLLEEDRYHAAQGVYEKLLLLRPREKWVRLSLDDAKYGAELNGIKELITQEKFSEAAQQYRYLLQQSPDNPNYYFGLGQMYMRLKEYGLSIDINLEGLSKNPSSNELRVALGYAYFFNGQLQEGKEVLTQALHIDAKNPEALAGLGRVNALEDNYSAAETLYRQALAIDPKNQSALSFLGALLIKERRYTEAQEVFAELWNILPDTIWVQRAWMDARDGPIRDLAGEFADREEFEVAAELYSQLIQASPDDPSRYLPLGQVFVNMQKYCCGIEVYEQGLMIDPEAWYLWRAIAFAYILMEDYDCAQDIFASLVNLDPKDVESWAGLGRIQALHGSMCLAEEYYMEALGLAPENLVALSFLADLREEQQYNFSALSVYELIAAVAIDTFSPSQEDPKWVCKGYNNVLNLTQPTLAVSGSYHEEKQWAPTVHRWSAEYLVFGGKALLNYPINDQLTLWGSAADQRYVLRDLLIPATIYSFDVQRFHLGSRWVLSSCLYLDSRAGITNFSPYRYGTFNMLHGTIAEPSLTLTYHRPEEIATISLSSDSDLVARDFQTNNAKMVGYYFITGTYSKRVFTRGWIGLEANATWYNDFVHNNSQRALGWLQWRPPFYSDNIIFRYYLRYQTFAKNIPDYYTYKPQVVNQLQLTLEKSWRVCWADSFYTSLMFGHGWQDTRTRFRQIIVVFPTPLQPFGWDRRQYNIVVGNIIYKYRQLQLTFTADYYRDTQKYTMWTLGGNATWRF